MKSPMIKQLFKSLGARRNLLLWGVPLLGLGFWLFLHRLGTLTPGLSAGEVDAARTAVGWHGIWQQPLDLPLKAVRSVVFFLFPDHGQLLTRLPNVLFGMLTVVTFAAVVRLWHGTRTALLATLLFATSAWTLHVSRLASYDVLYLWALPTLLLSHMLVKKYGQKPLIWYGSLLSWGLLLYIPGMVWPLLLSLGLQWQPIIAAAKHYKQWWQQLLSVFAVTVWLPLLVINLTRPHQLISWLGLPEHWATGGTLIKQFLGVPVHLFIRGPQDSQLWLGRAPLLDILVLAMCLLGIYFYSRHLKASRSRLLGSLFIVGIILVGMGGLVGLSLLVPLLYLAAATGVAYLSRQWLQVFPNNPLARGLGVGLIVVAVSLSCVYNLRAYFVAWPHTAVTRSTFHYQP